MELLAFDPTGERARLLLAARSAPVAAAAFVASLLAYALLPAGSPLVALADVASLVLALALVGMAVGFPELTWPRAPGLTSAIATFGVVAGLAAAGLAVALATGGPAALVAWQGAAFAGLGAWLAAQSLLALAQRALPSWACVAGALAGLGFVVGSLAPNPDQGGPLLALAGALALGLPAWAWAARRALFEAAGARPGQPAWPLVNA
jgi:hypothetical protein